MMTSCILNLAAVLHKKMLSGVQTKQKLDVNLLHCNACVLNMHSTTYLCYLLVFLEWGDPT